MKHPKSVQQALANPAGQRIPILIVDDDPVLTMMLGAMLSAAGYSIRVAADGKEAVEALQHFPASVVISDWHMPEIDGLELCRRIRAQGNKPYVYFILITANGGKQQYASGMDAGADDFITKPVDLDELRARLHVAERILGLRQEVQRLEGLLPICSYCKRIHDESGKWDSLEEYVETHSAAQFSHGICEDCYAKVIQPQLDGIGPA